jgi:hypothetical protein
MRLLLRGLLCPTHTAQPSPSMRHARACARVLQLCGARAAAAGARHLSSSRMYDINWFAVLGVAPTASQADIKAAFRQHAKSMHPDVAPAASRQAQDAFKMISEARRPRCVCHVCVLTLFALRRMATSKMTACACSSPSASPPPAPPLPLAEQPLQGGGRARSTTRVPVAGSAPAPRRTAATRGSTTGSRSAGTRSTGRSRATTPTTTPRPRSTWGDADAPPTPPPRCHLSPPSPRSAYLSIVVGICLSLGVFLSPPKRDPFLKLARVPGTGKPGPEVQGGEGGGGGGAARAALCCSL